MECTVHDTTETLPNGIRIWPYRCFRCGQCFICKHKQREEFLMTNPPKSIGWTWICEDGTVVPAAPSPGVKVE